jgi:hypothetical protein
MPADPPLVLEGGLFVREDGWCPAKGPTETKPSKQAWLSFGTVRISAGPPSGLMVLAAGPTTVGEGRGLTA